MRPTTSEERWQLSVLWPELSVLAELESLARWPHSYHNTDLIYKALIYTEYTRKDVMDCYIARFTLFILYSAVTLGHNCMQDLCSLTAALLYQP